MPPAKLFIHLGQMRQAVFNRASVTDQPAQEPYERIIEYELGELPEPLPADAYGQDIETEEIPF